MSTQRDKLIVMVNSDVKMSRGKFAAQAVHAALTAVGAHPGCAVVVLGGKTSDIAEMPVTIIDAGLTEIPPGTLTAGAALTGPERYVPKSKREDENAG